MGPTGRRSHPPPSPAARRHAPPRRGAPPAPSAPPWHARPAAAALGASDADARGLTSGDAASRLAAAGPNIRGLRLAGVLAALAALAVPAGGVAGAQPAVPVGAAVAAAPRARLDAGAPHGNVCTGQTRVDTEAAGVAGRACAPPAPVLDRRAARREPPPDGRGRRLGVVLGLEVRLVPVVPLCGGRTTAAQCEAAAP